MPITMYDSVDLDTIPADAVAVAGYVDGRFQTFDTVKRRWPRALHLSIATDPRSDAHCLDVEPGDAGAIQVPGWVDRQRRRGVARPVIYASLDAMPLVLARLRMAEIPRDHYRLWTAHWTGKAHRCSHLCLERFQDRAGATQWTDRALGRNLDASNVFSEHFFQR